MLVLLRYNSESIQSYCLLYTKKILVIHLTISLILSLKGILRILVHFILQLKVKVLVCRYKMAIGQMAVTKLIWFAMPKQFYRIYSFVYHQ